MSYAYICNGCDHFMSGHLWDSNVDGGSLREGPYRCAECDCVVAQDASCYGISARQTCERRGHIFSKNQRCQRCRSELLDALIGDQAGSWDGARCPLCSLGVILAGEVECKACERENGDRERVALETAAVAAHTADVEPF